MLRGWFDYFFICCFFLLLEFLKHGFDKGMVEYTNCEKDEMKEFLDHVLIQPGKVEKRAYQLNVYEKVRNTNALVVLPTGLGKTIIALFVLVDKVSQGRKVLFLAPTKPLCEQHAAFIKRLTTLSSDEVAVVTGETYTPVKRKTIYEKTMVVVATPQTIIHDIDECRLSIGDYGLIIFDEVHRSVGDYAYVSIARKYSHVSDAQILGLTASPGSDFMKLKEVVINLNIKHIEIRSEWDDDVQPYLSKRFFNWYLIEMPEEIGRVTGYIDEILQGVLHELCRYTRQARNLTVDKLSKKALIEIQARMKRNLGRRGGSLYHGLSIVSTAVKLAHLRDILTSQGVNVAKTYVEKIEKDDSRAARRIKKHPLYPEIKTGIENAQNLQPKLETTEKMVITHLQENSDARIMIFAEYRDTVDMLFNELKKIDGVRPVQFIGQTRTTGEKGMSQREQKVTLERFRKGTYNVLVSTSIGEEGIDIPATSLVIFYEPVPSAIRHIQRKGRTARDGAPGRVQVLIMKGSRDEGYYWSSIRKEKKMYRLVYQLKNQLEKTGNINWKTERQTKLNEFSY